MLTDLLQADLDARREAGLYRGLRVHDGAQGPVLSIAGREYLNFCSNDYLGLAADPRLRAALARADCGVGAGAAHLVNGHQAAHQALENALAEYTGRPRALLFSTGYMANVGVISALLGREDAVFLDKLDHASLVDGALLSRAALHRYPHNDLDALEGQLARSRARRKLIATDGVFSMDGDLAPLPEIAALAERHGAWLMVDDAHGLGVIGASGRGTLEHYGLELAQAPILVGTLGKAFGVSGAFVAGSETLIEYLIQFARSYIYTTALPPPLAYATLEALRIAQDEGWRRQHLFALIQRFRAGLPGISPIQPVLLGSAEHALAASRALFERGILIGAIRPPTVPRGTARLRITLSAAHTAAQVDQLKQAMSECGLGSRENEQGG
jgi:8-amino-7-oxononanoate synthase